MSYAQTEVKTNKNKSRNIIWFNPPFSQNVKTSTGKIFLKLIKKTFPKPSQSPQNFQSKHHQINL